MNTSAQGEQGQEQQAQEDAFVEVENRALALGMKAYTDAGFLGRINFVGTAGESLAKDMGYTILSNRVPGRPDDPSKYHSNRFEQFCSNLLPCSNRANVVACLVDRYAVDPNHCSAAGRSGLELAARAGLFDVCEVLVRRGATLTAYALEHYGADLEEDEEEEEEEWRDDSAIPIPLSEEAKDERRAALLLLLPEAQRRAEQLTRFRHAANWRRRRNLMTFLAEGGHRPLSYRVAAGQADPPPGLDARTRLTCAVFSEEKGVAHLIMSLV